MRMTLYSLDLQPFGISSYVTSQKSNDLIYTVTEPEITQIIH